MLALDRPELLLLLPLAALPLVLRLVKRSGHPQAAALPADALSTLVQVVLVASGVAAFALLILGLAGLHRPGGSTVRTGTGAHLAVVIDRSSSMDNTFAGGRSDELTESKAAAARRLLVDFVTQRPHDRIAVVGFSTSPMLFLPMTDHRDAVRAAVNGIDEPGLSQTDVGRGLAMALSQFEDTPATASRAIMLVSDGAALIAPKVQAILRAEATRKTVNIYWLYMRSERAQGIFEPVAPGEMDTPQLRPERHLHLFLQDLGVPYRAFEAEDVEAVAEAIAEIDNLEARPLSYEERVPRHDLAPLAYGAATVAILALVLARLAERPFTTPSVRRPRGPATTRAAGPV